LPRRHFSGLSTHLQPGRGSHLLPTRSLFGLAYDVGAANLPDGQSAKSLTRERLDRLGIGKELKIMPLGSKKVKLPRSPLANKDRPPATNSGDSDHFVNAGDAQI
jgi:hypothetical protein